MQTVIEAINSAVEPPHDWKSLEAAATKWATFALTTLTGKQQKAALAVSVALVKFVELFDKEEPRR